jgi:23S rRNA pseudouridine2457 synthase
MPRYRYFLLYKPYMVLCQFSPEAGKRTLGEVHAFPKDVYPVGRLDEDSEGLLLLTNDPRANARLLGTGIEKEYYAQVEGAPTESALDPLRKGVEIRVKKEAYTTLPARVSILAASPTLPPREPPIRYRAAIPTAWISITLREGKNRQVRRMTASVGFPTLRLVRWRFGEWTVAGMESGEVREVSEF